MEKTGTYKALNLEKFGEKTTVIEKQFRELQKGEVLLKIMCTTVRPADEFLMKGQYGKNLPSLPLVPGMEGSGVIVDVAEGLDKSLIGKHAAAIFSSSNSSEFHGAWAEYSYASIYSLLVFDEKLEFDKIYSAQINPFTAVGMIDTIREHGVTSIAQSGSSSEFGRMFLRLCINQGIEVINLVRKNQTIEELTKFGGKHFVNTSENGWQEKFKNLAAELNVTVMFDCLGGDLTGQCLTALPDGSTLYHFGNLELKNVSSVSTHDLIFRQKIIKGWWLSSWFANSKIENVLKWKNFIKEDYEKGAPIFSTSYDEAFKFEDHEKAFESYRAHGKKPVIKFY